MYPMYPAAIEQPFLLSTDEQLQLFSMLPPPPQNYNSYTEPAKKINYCKHCFVQFDRKAAYTDHIRSVHQTKAKVGLGKGKFVITVQRHFDGHFFCPCGNYSCTHPKPLACHMKKCPYALNLDPELNRVYPQSIYPDIINRQVVNDVGLCDNHESQEQTLAESA
jgi:hypothetical protein